MFSTMIMAHNFRSFSSSLFIYGRIYNRSTLLLLHNVSHIVHFSSMSSSNINEPNVVVSRVNDTAHHIHALESLLVQPVNSSAQIMTAFVHYDNVVSSGHALELPMLVQLIEFVARHREFNNTNVSSKDRLEQRVAVLVCNYKIEKCQRYLLFCLCFQLVFI